MSIPRIGTIDDFTLQNTKFKPRVETFEKDRCAWLQPAKVDDHTNGPEYLNGKSWKSLHDGTSG